MNNKGTTSLEPQSSFVTLCTSVAKSLFISNCQTWTPPAVVPLDTVTFEWHQLETNKQRPAP